MPQEPSEFLGQLDILITGDADLIHNSTFIIVKLVRFCDISWGTTFTHLPSISYYYSH